LLPARFRRLLSNLPRRYRRDTKERQEEPISPLKYPIWQCGTGNLAGVFHGLMARATLLQRAATPEPVWRPLLAGDYLLLAAICVPILAGFPRSAPPSPFIR
jgi:hypothetical protein